MAPVFRAILAQAVAFGLLLLLPLVGVTGLPAWMWALIDGLLAIGASLAFGLPWWWLPLQGALPIVCVVGADLPAWAWAAGAVGLALVYGGGAMIRVPLYLSSSTACRALSGLVPHGACVIDLGCGLGGPVRALARARPDARIVGVEASVLLWLIARLRVSGLPNARIRFGSFWRTDLTGMDVAYAFLSPEPMSRLWTKVCAEMPPGSLLVSNTFPVPGQEPERTIPLPERSDAALYLYRIPARAPGSERMRRPAGQAGVSPTTPPGPS